MATSTIRISSSHRQALTQVIAEFGGLRFRRFDLAARIYAMTSPRNRERANKISEGVLREAEAGGTIRREGHQHWIKVVKERSLVDGSVAAELPALQDLVLSTKCPAKWLAVDLETGDVWRGSTKGWRRHAGQHSDAASSLLVDSKLGATA